MKDGRFWQLFQKEYGLTQEKLAYIAGLSQPEISRIINNYAIMTGSAIMRIADYFKSPFVRKIGLGESVYPHVRFA